MQILKKHKKINAFIKKITIQHIIIVGSALTAVICIVIIASVRFKRSDTDNIKKISKIKNFKAASAQIQNEQIPIDFNALKKINPDIYAWITVPNTNIDYPLLRSEEEDFYLTHNAEKKKSAAGALYTQSYNSDDFTDFNTVIYGHNMINGSMFGGLAKYRNSEYFSKNQNIHIYTPDKVFNYRIFAAYVYNDTHILLNYSLTNIAQKVEYLEDIYSGKYGGNLREDLRVTASDKIITLSTCTSDKKERFLVQAVLVSDSQ